MNGTSPTSNGPPLGQALPLGTRVGEFIIERVLGSGGFGITYLARDKRLGREAVIKENLPAQFCWRNTTSLMVQPRQSSGEDADNFQYSLASFEKEAAMLASLDHPGIVKVLRSFEANGTAYFVMPFVEGVTFDEVIKERQAQGESFSEEELTGLLWRVLDALSYLHERGIYHRDIKPGNILITATGEPVLIDFGAARQRLSERSLTVIESPGYTPFEQMQSRGHVGPWSDLYALGGSLYKAITGDTPEKAADRVIDDPLLRLATCSDLTTTFSHRFLESLDRVLAFNVRDRFQDAESWRRWIWDPMPSLLSLPDDQPNLLSREEGGDENSASEEQLQASYSADSVFGRCGPTKQSLSDSAPDDGFPPIAPPLQSFKPIQDGKRNESVLSTSLPIPTAPSIIALLIILLSAAVQVQATTTSSLWSVEKWFYAVIAHLMIVGMCSLVLATLAGAVFALFKVPFMKTFSRAYTITVLLVSISMLFVSFSLFKLNSRNRTAASDIAKAKATIAALGDDVSQFQAHMENLNEPGADESIQFNKTSTATTDIEKVHEVIRSVMQETAVIQEEYKRELTEGGLDDLLNAQRIAADTGLAQSGATLLKLRQITESYKKRSNATMESIPDKIRSYTFEHTTIEKLLDGLQAGLRSGLSKNERIWNLELEVFDHLESALRFIESSRTRWQTEDGLFVFELDADLNRFNSILEEINRCAEEQDEIRNSAKNSALERLDKLKSKF